MESSKVHLRDILNIKAYMKIVIDECVDIDDNGNYLINIGYLRVSTDRQAELGYGLDIQENEIVSYCNGKVSNLVLFIDDGYTGTNMQRPALEGVTGLINAFNSGRSNIRVNMFVVYKIDRLGRTLLGTLQFIQDYIVSRKDSKSPVNRNAEDINFVSVKENYCRFGRDDPSGKFLLMLFATLAEFDRDQIVEKMRRGREQRVASGKWPGGGGVPYGYRYDKESGILVIVPEEAEKIKEIFRLYLEEKLPPQKIADRLGFKGDKIVFQILKRKSLTGCTLWRGVEYSAQHEPIISYELWEAAQAELERRSAHRTDTSYLLSGLVYCGECGSKMRYQKWGNSGRTKLICYSTQSSTAASKPHLVKDPNCPNEKYWADEVENAVISQLLAFDYTANKSNKKSAPTSDALEVLKKEQKAVEKKLSNLYDAFSADPDDILKEKISSLKKQINDIKKQISDEEREQSIARKIKKTQNVLRNLRSTWPAMSEKERQIICQELISKIVIFRDGRIDVHLKMEKFLSLASE